MPSISSTASGSRTPLSKCSTQASKGSLGSCEALADAAWNSRCCKTLSEVYFHSSVLRSGKPCCISARRARWRSSPNSSTCSDSSGLSLRASSLMADRFLGRLGLKVRVAVGFKLAGQLGTARLDNATVRQNVNMIGRQIFEQALIVGNDYKRRSEERRVGKECRSRRWPDQCKQTGKRRREQ